MPTINHTLRVGSIVIAFCKLLLSFQNGANTRQQEVSNCDVFFFRKQYFLPPTNLVQTVYVSNKVLYLVYLINIFDLLDLLSRLRSE